MADNIAQVDDSLFSDVPISQVEQAPASQTPAPQDDSLFSDVPISAVEAPAPTKEEKPSSFLHNLVKNEWVKDDEINEIASKYKIGPEVLRTVLDFNLAGRELAPEEADVKGFLISTAKNIGGLANVGTGRFIEKAIKQFSMDKNTQKAVDEAVALADERKNYLQKAGEILIPGVGIGGKAVKGAYKALETAKGMSKAAQYAKIAAASGATGALYGYGGSETGEEVAGTAVGAGLGAALPLGLGAVAKGVAKGKELFSKESDEVVKALDRISPASKYNLVLKAEEAYTKNAEKEADIAGNLVRYVKEGELSNPMIGKEIVSRKFSDPELADEAYEKLKSKYAKSTGIENDLELDEALSKSLIEKEGLSLAKSLDNKATKDTAMDVLKNHLAGLGGTGEEGLLKRQQLVSRQKYMLSEAEKLGEKLAGEDFNVSWVDRWLLPRDVLDKIDTQYGTTFTSHLTDMINGMEKVGLESHGYMEHAKSLLKNVSRIEAFRGEEGGKLLSQIIDAGEEGANRLQAQGLLTKDEVKAARSVAELFTEAGMDLNVNKGMAIPLMKAADGSANYFPVRLKTNQEIKSILTTEFETLRPKLETRKFSELGEREKDFIKSLSIATGTPIADKTRLWKAMKSLKDESPVVARKLNAARATMQRKGEVPDLIREYNVGKVMEGYIKDMYRYAAMKEPIAAMKLQQKVLKQAGSESASLYIDKLMQDVLSGKEKTVLKEQTDKWRSKYIKELLSLQREKETLIKQATANIPSGEKISNIGKYVREQNPKIAELEGKINNLRFKQDAPELFLNTMQESFSAGMLGGKIKQGLRDLYQPYTMGIQEIGGKFGASVMLKATGDTLAGLKNLKQAEQRLADLGHVSKEFAGEISTSREVGDMASEWAKMGYKGLKKMNQAFMLFRRTAEVINRTTMLNAANHIADEYLAGNKEAVRYANKRLSEAYKTRIAIAEKQGTLSRDKLVEWVANDLIDKTQFRYHPAMKSEMARTLGPFFSQFSQYPAGVASSLVTEFRKHGAAATASRAIAPVLGLYGLHSVYDYIKDEDELSDRESVLFYKAGAIGAAPTGALPGLVLGAGPSSKLVQNTLKILEDPADAEKWQKVGGDIAKSFNPFGAAANFVNDMMTLFTGERPEPIFTSGQNEAPSAGELASPKNMLAAGGFVPSEQQMADITSAAETAALLGAATVSPKALSKVAKKLEKPLLKLGESMPVQQAVAHLKTLFPSSAEWAKIAKSGQFADIPGLVFKDTKSTIEVIVDGKKIGEAFSPEKARTIALEWKRKNLKEK